MNERPHLRGGALAPLIPLAGRATLEPFGCRAKRRRLSAFNLTRLYRVHVSARRGYGPERTAFVEAGHRDAAARKIATAIAALEYGSTVESVLERVYNITSRTELVAEGLSPDLRVFDTGWSGGEATHFVDEPLFLLERPAALIRKWAQIPPEQP